MHAVVRPRGLGGGQRRRVGHVVPDEALVADVLRALHRRVQRVPGCNPLRFQRLEVVPHRAEHEVPQLRVLPRSDIGLEAVGREGVVRLERLGEYVSGHKSVSDTRSSARRARSERGRRTMLDCPEQ